MAEKYDKQLEETLPVSDDAVEASPDVPEEEALAAGEQEVADFIMEEAGLAVDMAGEDESTVDSSQDKPQSKWRKKLSAFLLASNVVGYMAMASEAEGGTRRHHPDDSWRYRHAGRRIGAAIQRAERQDTRHDRQEIVQKIRYFQRELDRADVEYRRTMMDRPSPERDRHLAELRGVIDFNARELERAEDDLRDFEIKAGLRRVGVAIAVDILTGR